jgi:cysteine-S-conjugate beta-lyase
VADTHIHDWDDLTAHDLREQGSLKWTTFGGDTIGAFVAEMDFGVASSIRHALREAVDSATLGYLPARRARALAGACANWQRERYGWPVSPEQILPVSDVVSALEVTIRHFSRPGSPVIVPTPTYGPLVTVPPRHGREIIQVPMVNDQGRYEWDLDGIERAFQAGGDLLVLCSPANPVGRVFTAEELTGLAALVDRHGGRVFADEVHGPLVYPGHRHVPYASVSTSAAAHTITATSASKAWNLGGLKCAQVILAPSDLDAWREFGAGPSTSAGVLGAVANTAAYHSGGHWLDAILAYLDRNRRSLAESFASYLPELGYRMPEGTYLAWLDCRALRLERPAEFFLEQAGVALMDGAEYGAAGTGFVRLNFATAQPIVQRMVTRMAHAYSRQEVAMH